MNDEMQPTMRAVAIDRFGGPEVLKLRTLPVPEVGPGEVLIRVQTAGVGEWDPFEREGGYAEMLGIEPKFALEGLVDRFIYLHYGLAAILTFVGAKLLLQGFGLHVPIVVSLLVILVAITASIVASLIATRGGKFSRVDDETVSGSDRDDTGSDRELELAGGPAGRTH